MNRSELRSLRLALVDGKSLEPAQALAVVSALEEIAEAVEEKYRRGPRELTQRCSSGNACPHEGLVSTFRIALRRASVR